MTYTFALGLRVFTRRTDALSAAKRGVSNAYLPTEPDLKMKKSISEFSTYAGSVTLGLSLFAAVGLFFVTRSYAAFQVVMAFGLVAGAFGIVNFFRFVLARWEMKRWERSGRPQDWRSPWVLRPSLLDIMIWVAIATVLLWAVLFPGEIAREISQE